MGAVWVACNCAAERPRQSRHLAIVACYCLLLSGTVSYLAIVAWRIPSISKASFSAYSAACPWYSSASARRCT